MIAIAGAKSPDALTMADVTRVFEQGNSARFAPDTRFRHSYILRRMLRELVAEGAPPNLDKAVPRIPRPAPRAVTLAADQVNKLLALAPAHLRLWLLLCHDCALRSGTAAAVTWAEIQGDCEELVTQTKGASVTRVPISGRLHQMLTLVPKRDGAPLVALLRGKPIGHCTLRKEFRALLAVAELSPNLRPHDLRRTMAEAAYKVTSDLRVVQRLLGHDSMFTTLRYLQRPAQATNAQLIAALEEVTK
jgi:integrase/recombinase XerD